MGTTKEFVISLFLFSFVFVVEGQLRKRGKLFARHYDDSSDDSSDDPDVVIRSGNPFGQMLNLPPASIQVLPQFAQTALPQIQTALPQGGGNFNPPTNVFVEEEQLLDLSIAPPAAVAPPPPPQTSQKPTAPPPTKKLVTITDVPVMLCPNGFVNSALNPVVCVKEDVQNSIEGCLAGWEFDQHNYECFRQDILPPLFFCDKGFTSEGPSCVKYYVAPKQLSCSEEFVLEGPHCARYVETSPDLFCNPGFHLDPETRTCGKHIRAAPEMACMPGYDLLNGMCMKNFIKPRSKKGLCALPYVPSIDGHCTKTEVFNAELVCPHGTALQTLHNQHDAVCEGVLHEPCEERCVDNFEPAVIGGVMICKGKIIARSQVSCPHDFHAKDNGCVREERCNKKAKCALPGYNYLNGQCVGAESMRPQPLCPLGYNLMHDTTEFCIKQLTTQARAGCADNSMVYDPIVEKCLKKDYIMGSPIAPPPIDFNLVYDTPF